MYGILFVNNVKRSITMPTRQDFYNFHCPRYEEFPSLELYAEQVLSLMKDYLEIFHRDGALLTSNMINNYVKQRIVKPPINKRYDRVHLSYFVVVCLLKGFMNISELCEGLEIILEKNTVRDAYNLFCDELEGALKRAFSEESLPVPEKADTTELALIRSMCTSLANLTLAHCVIEEKKLLPSDRR